MAQQIHNGAPQQELSTMETISFNRSNMTSSGHGYELLLLKQQQQHQHTGAVTEYFQLPSSEYLGGLLVTILAIIVLTRRRWQKARQQQQNNGIMAKRESSSVVSSLATLKQVSSSASFARLSEAMRGCFKNGDFVASISAPESFVPTSLLEKISLQELSTIISYTLECNRSEFDEAACLAKIGSPHVKEVIAAVHTAVMRSRGVNVLPSKVSGSVSGGDFDALYFCASMRLLVEWRSIKIVPEEYKAYAVGMNVAKRDLIQNAAKVEDAVHRWIEQEVVLNDNKKEVSSPTIRQILHYERRNGVHARLPKLKDKTAAIGILWMTRQLQFQTEIFSNFTKVPTTYKSAIEAVRVAYKTVFNSYHGWAIQQVFNYSFKGAPPVALLFRMMNPEILQGMNTEDDGDTVIVDYPAPPPNVTSSFASSIDGDYDDDEDDLVMCEGFNLTKLGDEIKGNWDKFAADVEREWSSFVDGLGGKKKRARQNLAAANEEDNSGTEQNDGAAPTAIVQKQRPSFLKKKKKSHRSIVPAFVLNEEALQQYVEKETTKTAHVHIEHYLTIMNPLVKELTSTINEFGMNDPSKV